VKTGKRRQRRKQNHSQRDNIAHLDEGLDLAPPRELLRAHTLGHLERVALNAGDDGVRVGALLCALIELPDHDDLVAGLTALEDDRDLMECTKEKPRQDGGRES
jgi:hypothetical protein